MIKKRHIANLITILRICLTIWFIILINHYVKTNSMQLFLVAACFLLIVLSDFADGQIARRLQITSRFGKILATLTDFFCIFSMHLFLYIHGMISLFVLLVIIEKIINYCITSTIIKRLQHKRFNFIKDPLGKIISKLYFFIPILVILGHAYYPEFSWVNYIFILPVEVCGICSSLYRWFSLVKIARNSQKAEG